MSKRKPVIEKLINSKAEIIDGLSAGPIVLSTRIRLARNLDYLFPNRADNTLREKIYDLCQNAAKKVSPMKQGATPLAIDDLSELHRQTLVERHLISSELMDTRPGAGVLISKDQSCSIMINEEDHLRLQVIKRGFPVRKAWRAADALDSALEEQLNYSFSPELGYLTACPTNLGTGMRASVMVHLPGLVIADQMEKVIRAVNQLGIAVRGLFGEGSDASGSIFQISNQQTLGESEQQILKRLNRVFNTIIEQEQHARARLLEAERFKLFDKIGRAFGILQYGHCVSSVEAMNLLSLMRLAVDIEVLPEETRSIIDRQIIESQPGHIQVISNRIVDSGDRDKIRADLLRALFKEVPNPKFS